MKVLLAATSSESFSGASKCLVELADQLEKKNIDVTVLLPRHGDLEGNLSKKNIKYAVIKQLQCWYIGKNEKIKFLNLKYLFNKLSILKTVYFIKKNNFDVVHINASTAYVPGVAAIKAGISLVWHLREFGEQDLNISFTRQRYAHKVLNCSTAIIAISRSVKEKWSKELVPEIRVIYDGLPIEQYYIKRDYKNSFCKTISILIYGRIVPSKGQLFFFKSIKLFKEQNDINIKCNWCGKAEDQSYFNKINSFLSDNNMGSYCNYLGEVTDIKGVLSENDIVCVCSTMEGFGRVTAESMISGNIVLGADTGATAEIIRDNKNGFLYKQNDQNDFANKLRYIINHMDAARKIALVGQKEAIDKYSIETDVNKVINIYKDVTEQKV